jgi:hypothetical protein
MGYERKTHDIFVSEELEKVLAEISGESIVANMLLRKRQKVEDLVENHINYLSISKDDKTKISYLTQDRIEQLNPDGYWSSSRRYQTKPGAFVSKIFNNIKAKDVEHFSNLFKSITTRENLTFDIIKGKEIKDYYHHMSYESQKGSLGSSCMKHEECQDFLKIYTKNSDSVSLLILLNDSGRIKGRALLWDTKRCYSYKNKNGEWIVEENGNLKIMDRIYTTNDNDLTYHFKKWASDNDYLYKTDQNWLNCLNFENLNTPKKELFIDIEVKGGFTKYPYMDTFKFLNKKEGTLSNYLDENNSNIITLCSGEGDGYDNHYYIFDNFERNYTHRNDSVKLYYLTTEKEDYNTSSRNVVHSQINDQYILKKDASYNEVIGDYIFNPDYDEFNSEEVKKSKKKKQPIHQEWMSNTSAMINFELLRRRS